jgi:MFS family permease
MQRDANDSVLVPPLRQSVTSGLPRPVWLLGWASLFTDAGTEMIYPLLPVYLSRVLGAGAMSLGIIEGIAEGVNSLLKVVSGRLSDKWSRRKPIVIAGYSLSSIARPFIAVTNNWTQVLTIRAIDRTGKGIRGAPRDAMLAQYTTASNRGLIYGFHRAMDHAGAVVGPLIATAFLLVRPGAYRTLFGLTIVPGALAVWMLSRVPEGTGDVRVPHIDQPRHAAQGNRDGRSAPAKEKRPWRDLPPRFYAVLGVLLLFSLGNSADAFLLLRLSSAIGHDAYVPLLWSLLHVVKASLSIYGGGLSDRIGRKAVIVTGWAIYSLVYIGFALSESAVVLIGWFMAYGIYFGLAEGTEKALVADMTPTAVRGTGFGLYNGVLGIGALLASVVFGALYERVGPSVAFSTGAGLAATAAVLMLFVPTPQVRA